MWWWRQRVFDIIGLENTGVALRAQWLSLPHFLLTYFKSNLLLKNEEVNCINNILEQKKIFGDKHILNYNEISFAAT